MTDGCGTAQPGLHPRDRAWIPENGGVAGYKGMGLAIPFPPRWLAPWSCPLIEDVACDLGGEHQRLYVKHLAQAVERGEPEPPSLAWRALERASAEIADRRRGEREATKPAAAGGGVA